jgi:hypothetical protein
MINQPQSRTTTPCAKLWIEAKRIRATAPGPTNRKAYRITRGELTRVAGILGVPSREPDMTPPVLVDFSDGPGSEPEWFVPPEERYSKPPAA